MLRNHIRSIALAACAFAVTSPAVFAADPTVASPAAAVVVNADSYVIEGVADADALVQVWADANDNGLLDTDEALKGSQQLAGGATAYTISVALAQDAPNNFLVTTTDAMGTQSAPTDIPTILEDSTAPALGPVSPADDALIRAVRPVISAVVTEDGAGVDEATIAVTLDGAVVTHTYDSATKTISYTPAADLAQGQHTVTVSVSDAAGNAAVVSGSTFTVDAIAPVADAPVHGLTVPSRLTSSSIPISLALAGSDDLSGVKSYQIQMKKGGLKWTWVRSATSHSFTVYLFPGQNYQFRARAIDRAGNVGAWATGTMFKVGAYQEWNSSIVYGGQWKATRLKEAYANGLRYTSVAGAQANFSFTGSTVAWVAQKSVAGGQAEVYIDGVHVATVDLYSPSKQHRQVVFSQTGLDPSVRHTLKVRALGTKKPVSKGTLVSVDAFLTLP